MDHLSEAEEHLLGLLDRTARGPKRNGVFALWLVVHVCGGFFPPLPRERAQRARLANVERRLSSLSVAAPLRRALAAAMREVRDGGREAAPIVLQQLAAPARDVLGPEAAQALSAAARVARTALSERSALSV